MTTKPRWFTPVIVGGTDRETWDSWVTHNSVIWARAWVAGKVQMVTRADGQSEVWDALKKAIQARLWAPTDANDCLANSGGVFVDTAFDKKIGFVLDTVDSLENSRWHRDRQTVWQQLRKRHNLHSTPDSKLKEIVMNADFWIIQTKPEYFTAICWEIMERVLGNVDRVGDE